MNEPTIWAVVLTDSTQRDLRRLDPPIAKRILEALSRFAKTGYGDIRWLREPHDMWRLRVGDWRVFYGREYDPLTLVVLHIRPRGEAYR